MFVVVEYLSTAKFINYIFLLIQNKSFFAKHLFNMKKENIYNTPNALSSLRILLTIVLIVLVILDINIITLVIIFSIAALTDFFDGQIARRFNLKTEFGRKLDMIADRILWIGFSITIIIFYTLRDRLILLHILSFVAIMSREIITAPFFILTLKKATIPHAKKIGKTVTFLQGVAIPALLIHINYPEFYLSPILTITTGILGVVSAGCYIRDMKKVCALKNR